MEQAAVRRWLADHDPLAVVPLVDPVVELVGHDPRSSFAETFWTPVLGPASVILLRRLADYLDDSPDGFPLPLGPAAATIGLGHSGGCNGRLIHTLERLVTFGMAKPCGDELAVRRMLPPLARRHIARLPGHLAERLRHEQALDPRDNDRDPGIQSLHLVGHGRLGKSATDPPDGGSGSWSRPARAAGTDARPA
jgi:hypothetical protein